MPPAVNLAPQPTPLAPAPQPTPLAPAPGRRQPPAEAACAVEACALGISDADTAGDESNDATTLLIALYNDASEGLQRTTRAMAKAARASSAQAAALKLTASAANTLAAAGSVLRQR